MAPVEIEVIPIDVDDNDTCNEVTGLAAPLSPYPAKLETVKKKVTSAVDSPDSLACVGLGSIDYTLLWVPMRVAANEVLLQGKVRDETQEDQFVRMK